MNSSDETYENLRLKLHLADLINLINNLVSERHELRKKISHLKNQWKGQCTLVDTLKEKITALTKQNAEYQSMCESMLTRPVVVGSNDYPYDAKIRELKTKITNLTKSRDDLRKNNEKLITESNLIKQRFDETVKSYEALLKRWT